MSRGRSLADLVGTLTAAVVLTVPALAASAVLMGTLWVGRGYYPLAVADRETHPLHAVLAPGGSWGVALGVLGTGAMVVLLAYTLRKWVPHETWLARWTGRLNHWLRFHILCGVFGPLFIVLHSAFIWPRGLVAIGFWCMVVVALSGTFGRYVYGFFPRVAGGRALAWDEAMARLADLRAELVAETATLHGDRVGQAVQVVTGFEREATHIGHLVTLGHEARQRRSRIRSLLSQADLAPDTRRRALAVLFDQLRLKRGMEASRVAHLLFRYWHLLHRPLAAAMYVIIALHIVTAVLLGGSIGALMRLFG